MRILLAAIYPYVFLLLYFIIPFDDYIRVLPNILFGILVVTFPFIVKKEDFSKLKKTPTLLLALFIVYLVGSAFFLDRLDSDFKIIKKILIAIGLVILYIPVSDFKKIKKAIVFSSLAAIIFSVINIIILSNSSGDFVVGNSPLVIEALLIDRLYLGFLSVLSILISVKALSGKYHPNNPYNMANIVVNVVFILIIASKMAVMLLIALLLLRLLYGKTKKWGAVLVFAVVIFVVHLISTFEVEPNSISEENRQDNSFSGFISNTVTWEIRSEVWKCANEISRSEGFVWFGLGYSKTKDKLVDCYSSAISNEVKKEKFISERYNTHNQFIDFYLSSGFIAIAIFVLFLAVVFISVRKGFFPTAMLLSLVFYCMVENVFHRQMGAYYIGFILIILLSKEYQMEIKSEKEE